MKRDQLSQRAQQIATHTLLHLDSADEIEGCNTGSDYLALMSYIIDECHRRRTACCDRMYSEFQKVMQS